MGLFLNLIFIIAVYILFGYILYKVWLMIFRINFGKLDKWMIKTSKIFGIVWPMTLPLLAIILIIFIMTYGR